MEKKNLGGHVQPLRNVSEMLELAIRLETRQAGLPGMGVFYGWTGLGKTMAAVYVTNDRQALYICANKVWTQSSLVDAILKELGVPPRGTVAARFDAAKEALAIADCLLIVDETDYLVQKNMIEMVRDLHDAAQVPVILIGEEKLPQSLLKWERVAGRILDWKPAQPLDRRDAGFLARHYADGVMVTDAALDHLVAETEGNARTISTQLAHVAEAAKRLGKAQMDVADVAAVDGHKIVAPSPRQTAPKARPVPVRRVANK